LEWEDSHIEIYADDSGFHVSDSIVGLEVRAEHVVVAENRKPMNAFALNSKGGLAE